jgi:hypothetical protein
MPSSPATYRGRDRRVRGQSGSIPAGDLVAFVEARFRAGWRSLVVERAGQLVGGVSRLDGRRSWWAEAAAGEERVS